MGTPIQKLQAANPFTKVWASLLFYQCRVPFARDCFGREALTTAITS